MIEPIEAPPAMVLGCGRSGTSIFGELFEGLTPYRYWSEPPFAEVMADRGDRPLAVKVPHESAGFAPDPGLSFPLETYLERFPNAVLFWIVRHPLDAISSLRVGIGLDWRHHPRPPDWEQWLDRPLVERCAHHWTHINSVGYAQISGRATLVHFEGMISAPYDFAVRVCEVLNLDPARVEPHLRTWAGRVQNTNNEAFVEARTSRNLSRPDHSVRVGRWRENLSEAEIAMARAIAGDTANQMGYTVD